MNTVQETADRIRRMEIRGAGRIARAGATAMAGFARSYEGGSLEDYLGALKESERIVLASRPTAVSLWNGVRSSVRGADDAESLEEARALVIANAADFCIRSEKAVQQIAAIGANRIQDGDTILTHCNSSAAIGAIVEAHRRGKGMKVYATETRPWRQGILTVNQLADAGVDVTLVVDSAVRTVMSRVDKVLVGADTVTSEGDLVNKVGTSHLALAARDAGARFYSCAETYKFSPKTMLGESVTIEERETTEIAAPGEVRDSVKIFNPVFDTTPARLIDAFVTEVGIMSPGSVYGEMARLLGDDIFQKEE